MYLGSYALFLSVCLSVFRQFQFVDTALIINYHDNDDGFNLINSAIAFKFLFIKSMPTASSVSDVHNFDQNEATRVVLSGWTDC